jgi:hypothetical protein
LIAFGRLHASKALETPDRCRHWEDRRVRVGNARDAEAGPFELPAQLAAGVPADLTTHD